ncbi:MAG: cytochrome c peroxidase [Gammaproteobacteria bacterium]
MQKNKLFSRGHLKLAVALFGILGYSCSQAANLFSHEQNLGRLLYKDKNLSLKKNQSCQSCHILNPITVWKQLPSGKFDKVRQPSASFADPDNIRNNTAVSDGSDTTKFGTLNTPSAGYAAFSPFFHWNADEGLYIGGQFWNGRVNTLAEQAAQPPLNPVEMAMPSKWAVVTRMKNNSRYVRMFKNIYKIDLDQIPAYELAPAGEIPPPGVFAAYDAMAKAIGEFEKSRLFNRFDSKFDFVMAGKASFTEKELSGFALFNGKGECSACHLTDMTTAPDGSPFPALLTDFTYDNLGVPRNETIPGNPEPNQGLGGRADIAAKDPSGSLIGAHKVMSLRNIALTPPYMHNGAFTTLAEVVHFYNTRDTKPRVCKDITDPGFGKNCWPEPEFPDTMNTSELGDLGLTAREEADIVAFMETLTDNYQQWGNAADIPKNAPSPFADVPLPPSP